VVSYSDAQPDDVAWLPVGPRVYPGGVGGVR
jgi:hypothetical protein